MYIYQDIEGKSLTKKEWMEKSHSKAWTEKEFRNSKISIAVHWIGRYEKRLPAEYRHSFGVLVKNRFVTKESEWVEEDVTSDKGWLLDPVATKTFRSLGAALAYYEELLLDYTASFLDETEDGDLVMIEEGNELAPKMVGAIETDEEQFEVAASKGIVMGGWS